MGAGERRLVFFIIGGVLWRLRPVADARWAFPLVVIGANSIVAYCLAHVAEEFVTENLRIHLGRDWYDLFGTSYGPLVEGAAVLICFYLILYWMYRHRVFVRI